VYGPPVSCDLVSNDMERDTPPLPEPTQSPETAMVQRIEPDSVDRGSQPEARVEYR
jgi:hypothetical protein